MDTRASATKARPWFADFDEVEIPPHETVFVRHRRDAEWDLVSAFRGEELIARESVLGATGIAFAFVGMKMQMPFPESIKGIPSMFFVQKTIGSGLLWDTCDHALNMTLVVTNNSDQAVKFAATINGKAVLK